MINSLYTLAHLVWLEGAGTESKSLDPNRSFIAKLFGAPIWSKDAPFADANSIVLDGTSQYITVPGLLASGPREFTVALRYKPNQALPDIVDRTLWSVTGTNTPEETLEVLWRQTRDLGGYLWVKGKQNGQPISNDVKIAGLQLPTGRWASLVLTAGVAGLYVYHNGYKVGGRVDFPWPSFRGGTDHDFTLGSLSSAPQSFLPAFVGEVLVEGRMWTDREAMMWHRGNARHLTEHSKWVKDPGNPVLAPTQPWEQDSLQEANLLYENGMYKLWYTGGWSVECICYATSPDGVTWTKCSKNPVLGAGNGNEPNGAARGFVLKVADTYYLYYNSDWPTPEKLATSKDGINWTSQGVIIPIDAWPWVVSFGNSCVWVEGGTWYMLFEALHKETNYWEMGVAKSTDGKGRNWNLLSQNPLRSLQIGTGMYGGPMVIKRGSVYHCWYHASNGAISPNLPTAIYRATSFDLINWKVYSTIPVLSLTQRYEVDQIADPTFIEVNGRGLMMVDQVDNSNDRGRLGIATFCGPVDSLVADSPMVMRGFPPIAALDLLLL